MSSRAIRDPRLLVQATPELLAGWRGPVVLPGRDGFIVGEGLHSIYVWSDGSVDRFLPLDLFVNLSRAECRDQMDRAIVAALDMPPGMKPEFTADEDGWSMLVGDLRDPAVGEMAVWDRDGRAAGCCKVDAPGLADIDPLDTVLLPDGSRLVDALARAAIWQAVKGAR